MNGDMAIESIRHYEKMLGMPRSFIAIVTASPLSNTSNQPDVQFHLQKPVLYNALEEAIAVFRKGDWN
jgi:hypothetical protein